MENATFEQYLEIGQMIKRGEIEKGLAQAVIEGRVTICSSIIKVPNLSASELLAYARKEIGHLEIDQTFAKWDFIRGERGKTYEVLTHYFVRGVADGEVLAYFKERGFVGNTAAFVAWVTKHKPRGWHMTVPEMGDRLRRGSEFEPEVPSFNYLDGGYSLFLNLVEDTGDRDMFVAFREIQQAA